MNKNEKKGKFTLPADLKESKLALVFFIITLVYFIYPIIVAFIPGVYGSVISAFGLMAITVFYIRRKLSREALTFTNKIFLILSVISSIISAVGCFISGDSFIGFISLGGIIALPIVIILLSSKIFSFVERIGKTPFIITEVVAFFLTPCIAALFSEVLGLVIEIILFVVICFYIFKFGAASLSFAFKDSVTASSPKFYYDKDHHAHTNQIDMEAANKKIDANKAANE